ncbi:hypothetical protein MRX96_018344 [Rhipicephalus microplus]
MTERVEEGMLVVGPEDGDHTIAQEGDHTIRGRLVLMAASSEESVQHGSQVPPAGRQPSGDVLALAFMPSCDALRS